MFLAERVICVHFYFLVKIYALPILLTLHSKVIDLYIVTVILIARCVWTALFCFYQFYKLLHSVLVSVIRCLSMMLAHKYLKFWFYL